MSVDLLPIAYARSKSEFGVALDNLVDEAERQGLDVYTTYVSPSGQFRWIIKCIPTGDYGDQGVDNLPDDANIVGFVQTRLIHHTFGTIEDVYVAKKE